MEQVAIDLVFYWVRIPSRKVWKMDFLKLVNVPGTQMTFVLVGKGLVSGG